MNTTHTNHTTPTGSAPLHMLIAAVATALALLCYFVLVVHGATVRGDSARLEQRMTGQIGSNPAGKANTSRTASRNAALTER